MQIQALRKCKVKFKGDKVTTEDIPTLSCYSGALMPHMSDSPILLSKLRPEGLSVNNPLRISMESATEYMIAYVQEIARRDLDSARIISESVYLPYVRKLDGKSSHIVEKKLLADIIRERARKLGREAKEGLRGLIEEANEE